MKLTPEQIKHWRNVLCVTIGPYALIMPDSEVQRIRDTMQSKFGVETDASNPQEQAATTAKTLTQEDEEATADWFDEQERKWSLREAGSNDGEGESYSARQV